MKNFTRKETETIIGIPARRIQFYSDSGLISLGEKNPGRGRGRLYSEENLLELFFIKELSKYKIELSSIGLIMADFRKKISLKYLQTMSAQNTPIGWLLFYDEKGLRGAPFNLQDPKEILENLKVMNRKSYLIINISIFYDQVRDL